MCKLSMLPELLDNYATIVLIPAFVDATGAFVHLGRLIWTRPWAAVNKPYHRRRPSS